ncbi:MAG: response regulator [Bacteroidota bacterium]
MSQPHDSNTNVPDDNKKQDPIKVMLADDDKDDQFLFEEALDKTPVDTELMTADDGKQLMDKLHDPEIPNPDIIFLDLNMPNKSGKECIAEIKSDDELKDIPVVIYSTSNSDKDVEDTYNAGASLYVSKPNSFGKIMAVLKNIFLFRWHKLSEKIEKKDFVVTEKT